MPAACLSSQSPAILNLYLMPMTTHPSPSTGDSQCQRILTLLQERLGEWVAMPELVRASGSYVVHSRIADLRARGHRVEHRNERKGRMVHSSYRLTTTHAEPQLF